jgi:hypothetical protein
VREPRRLVTKPLPNLLTRNDKDPGPSAA